MFRRLILEEWQNVLLIIGFVLAFTGFVLLVARALAMRKIERKYLAHLPLKEDDGSRPARQESASKPKPPHEKS